MASFHRIRKIIWAIDAFQERSASLRNVAASVTAAARTFGAKVEVVFACPVVHLPVVGSTQKTYENPYIKEAENNLAAIADLLGKTPHQTKLIVRHPRKKNVEPIEMLLDHAHKTKADLIVVATHGRNALVKLFLGSFAESLLVRSRIPLLVVGPQLKLSDNHTFKNLFMPTDLSKKSRAIYQEVLKMAAQHKQNVTLMHALVNEFIPAVQADAFMMGGLYAVDSEMMRQSVQKQKSELDAWVAQAARAKVNVHGEITDQPGLVSDLIVHEARKTKSDLVVMSTHSGAGTFELLGSVTKKVLRHSSVPVLAVKD